MCPVFSINLVFLCLKVFETSFQNRINFLYNSRFLRLFCLNYIKSRLHFQLFSASMKSDHFAIASSDWNGIQSFFSDGTHGSKNESACAQRRERRGPSRFFSQDSATAEEVCPPLTHRKPERGLPRYHLQKGWLLYYAKTTKQSSLRRVERSHAALSVAHGSTCRPNQHQP